MKITRGLNWERAMECRCGRMVKTDDKTTKVRCWVCVAQKAGLDKITTDRDKKAELYLKGMNNGR